MIVQLEKKTPIAPARVNAISSQRAGKAPLRIETKARQMRSAAAVTSTQKGSHTVSEATVRVAPAMSIAKGSGGSVPEFLGSATVERKLFQTTLPVRESFTEGHLDSRELQPVAQAPLLGEHDPASKPRQPRLRLHARGEPIPVEPELGGGSPREELGEQELAPRRGFPADMARRIARVVRPQAREIVGTGARRDRVAGIRVGMRKGQGGRIGSRVYERAQVRLHVAPGAHQAQGIPRSDGHPLELQPAPLLGFHRQRDGAVRSRGHVAAHTCSTAGEFERMAVEVALVLEYELELRHIPRERGR